MVNLIKASSCAAPARESEQQVKYLACPADADGQACYGHGECVTRAVGALSIKQCCCDRPVAGAAASNFFGFACNISQARTQEL